MTIYGVSVLAFCYIAGQLFGEVLGKALGINSNIGGVGFAMLFLILLGDWLKKKGVLETNAEKGIQFWNQMYIPIIVAMASTLNVKSALSNGLIAILAGVVPVVICLFCIRYLNKLSATEQD